MVNKEQEQQQEGGTKQKQRKQNIAQHNKNFHIHTIKVYETVGCNHKKSYARGKCCSNRNLMYRRTRKNKTRLNTVHTHTQKSSNASLFVRFFYQLYEKAKRVKEIH